MPVRRLDDDEFDWDTGRGGAAEVATVLQAAREADQRSPLNEAALLNLRHHGLGGAVMLLAGGSGFAYLHGLSGEGRPEVDLVVAPQARGLGLGTELADAVVALAPELPLTAWSHGNHPAAASVARRHGFRPARRLLLLRRGLDSPPEGGRPPEGVRIRPFRPGQDEEAFLAVNAAAFAGHPEQAGLTAHGLRHRMAEPWFDPDGLLLAVRGEELLGFHWTKVHSAADGSPEVGEVYVIGVAPQARGSGLGGLLLSAGLAHLAERPAGAPDEVVLFVEADNAAALRLYDRLGFTHAARDTDVMYARP